MPPKKKSAMYRSPNDGLNAFSNAARYVSSKYGKDSWLTTDVNELLAKKRQAQMDEDDAAIEQLEEEIRENSDFEFMEA